MSYRDIYKSMSFEQLLDAKLPIWIDATERKERLACIGDELRIKAPRTGKIVCD